MQPVRPRFQRSRKSEGGLYCRALKVLSTKLLSRAEYRNYVSIASNKRHKDPKTLWLRQQALNSWLVELPSNAREPWNAKTLFEGLFGRQRNFCALEGAGMTGMTSLGLLRSTLQR
uniref:Uncharacterized protein n=1 Tax=Coccidioides posadasii RMSCC 3488 TaxID=454284 RepID=A0A0J6I673_COCPO|nr:hypothetical protein CPAG_03247 [Coccidioides posadasii RMSCC 3488]